MPCVSLSHLLTARYSGTLLFLCVWHQVVSATYDTDGGSEIEMRMSSQETNMATYFLIQSASTMSKGLMPSLPSHTWRKRTREWRIMRWHGLHYEVACRLLRSKTQEWQEKFQYSIPSSERPLLHDIYVTIPFQLILNSLLSQTLLFSNSLRTALSHGMWDCLVLGLCHIPVSITPMIYCYLSETCQ